jgi:hypothetical protein
MARSIITGPHGTYVTDGDRHSSEAWGEATADHILAIGEHITGERRAHALKLKAAIAALLEGHHGAVQTKERGGLSAQGAARLTRVCDVDEHLSLETVTGEVISAADGTPWESAFRDPEFAPSLSLLLASHFRTNMEIERSCYADANIAAPEAQAFKASMHPGVGE